MKRLATAALSVLLLTGASDTDWKWFGASTIDGETLNTLYEARGVKRSQDGHVQVWMKTIAARDLNKAKLSDAVRDQAVGRAVHGYKPPGFDISNLTKKQFLDVVLIEAFANEAVLPSKMTMLWELDCNANMSRVLSVHVDTRGNVQTSDVPGPWTHVAPETNAARLTKALCPK